MAVPVGRTYFLCKLNYKCFTKSLLDERKLETHPMLCNLDTLGTTRLSGPHKEYAIVRLKARQCALVATIYNIHASPHICWLLLPWSRLRVGPHRPTHHQSLLQWLTERDIGDINNGVLLSICDESGCHFANSNGKVRKWSKCCEVYRYARRRLTRRVAKDS